MPEKCSVKHKAGFHFLILTLSLMLVACNKTSQKGSDAPATGGDDPTTGSDDPTTGSDDPVLRNGLTGTYYNGISFDQEVFDRLDSNLDFDWGENSPDSRVQVDSFSIRWTGSVESRFTETHKFITVADDGVRLWIDNKLVIDDWNYHTVQRNEGEIPLTAGQRHTIKVEYFDNLRNASIKLLWSSASQPEEVVPTVQLFTDYQEGDNCPDDPNKTDPGECGCGVPEGSCSVDDCNGDVEGIWDAVNKGGKLSSGPMVGHITDKTAQIWAYAGQGNVVEVMYQRLGDCPGQPVTISMPPRDTKNYTSLADLSGLATFTPYRYQILVNNSVAVDGTFKTAPTPNKAVKFSYMFGSGIRIQQHPDQPVWDEVLNQNPAFQIFNGDNVYSDTTDYNGIWNRHIQQREVANFAKLLRYIPTYATWDDHDYADNNSDGNAAGKENSLRAFTHLWANPSYGTASNPGVFFTFHWGDVQFFVVDNRYHRMNGKYLGDTQLQWLKDGLRSSSAVFKIIVHGGTIRRAGDESWFTRDDERIELLNFIKENRITGILFHGGDVHQNWFNPYPLCPRDDSPEYDVYEIVSSGLTYNRRYTMVEIDTTGKPTLTYRFYQDGGQHELGTVTIEDDGKLRHDLLEREVPLPNECQDKTPTYAFPG